MVPGRRSFTFFGTGNQVSNNEISGKQEINRIWKRAMILMPAASFLHRLFNLFQVFPGGPKSWKIMENVQGHSSLSPPGCENKPTKLAGKQDLDAKNPWLFQNHMAEIDVFAFYFQRQKSQHQNQKNVKTHPICKSPRNAKSSTMAAVLAVSKIWSLAQDFVGSTFWWISCGRFKRPYFQ